MANCFPGLSKLRIVQKGISLKSSLNLPISNSAISLINSYRVWYFGVEFLAIMYGASWSLIEEHSKMFEWITSFGIFFMMWSIVFVLFFVGNCVCWGKFCNNSVYHFLILKSSLMLILVSPVNIIVPVNVEVIIDSIVSILFSHTVLSSGFALGW